MIGQLGGLERFSIYRSHAPPPDEVVGGSNNIENTAVWSRDDLVPVGFSGYRIDEFALRLGPNPSR